MYMPLSLDKLEYPTKEEAIERAKYIFSKGNAVIFASVGLKFDPVNFVVDKEDDHYFNVVMDQGVKYDMTDEARKLFLSFFSKISEDFANKTLEERKEFV